MKHNRQIFLILSLALGLQGCSIKQFAVTSLGNALSAGGNLYASDNDIQLVGEALPFSLKTVEGLLAQVPEHKGLLITAASGFSQYSYVYVELPAKQISQHRLPEYQLRRAKNFYLRGFNYALRAVELTQKNFMDQLRIDPDSALSAFNKNHVPELYWLAISLGAAISIDKMDMGLVADLHLIEPIIQKCLELDESFNKGALHEFMIAYEGGRSTLQGGSTLKAREHFSKAMEFSANTRVSPLVSLAETVSVAEQNQSEFQSLLHKALAFNVDENLDSRLANLVAQEKARMLLSQQHNLFLED